MKKRLVYLFAVAALAMASAKSYRVTLYSPAVLGTTELKPGEYRVEVVNEKAIVRNGRVEAEVPVKVEANDAKYGTTTVRFKNGEGKLHVQEIHVGGTTTKLVFSE